MDPMVVVYSSFPTRHHSNDDQMTTTVNTATAATAQKLTTSAVGSKKTPPRWKWSGSDEPQSYYCHEDTDTMTLSSHELRYIRWYNTHGRKEWRDDDEE